MKKVYFTLLLIACFVSLYGQVHLSPAYRTRTLTMVDIAKVTVTKKYTIVEMTCTSPPDYNFIESQTFVYIEPKTHIKDTKTGTRYKLIRAENIPMSPGKRFLYRPNETFKFKLYFPSIPKRTSIIDIIEDESLPNGFNFFKVMLQPVA